MPLPDHSRSRATSRSRSSSVVFAWTLGIAVWIGALGWDLVAPVGTGGRGSAVGPNLASAESPACNRLLDQAIQLLAASERTKDPQKARDAIKLLDEAERICPDDVPYTFWNCRAHIYAGDYDGSRASLERLKKKTATGDPTPTWIEAEIHLRLGNAPDLAITGFRAVRNRSPIFLPEQLSVLLWQAYMDTATALVRGREFVAAIGWYRQAVNESRTSPTRSDVARFMLAQAYRFADRWKESEPIWADLVQRYPEDVRFHYGYASTLADQFQYAQAIEEWKIVLRLLEEGKVPAEDRENLKQARMRYGICLQHTEKADKAKEGRDEMLRYLKEAPDDARVYYYLGMSEQNYFDDIPKATEYLEKSFALDPFCEETLHALYQIYTALQKNPERAKFFADLLNDEAAKEARRKERERRKREREDITDGCPR